MRSRKKTILLSAALGIAVIAAAAAWLVRGAVLERWWVYRLSSDDPEVRAIMVARLGRSGQDAAARALAEGLASRTLGPGAAEALGAISERLRPATKVWVARKLLQGVDTPATVMSLLGDLAERETGILDAFSEVVESLASPAPAVEPTAEPTNAREPGLDAPRLSILVLARAWPKVRERMDAWLARAEPESLSRFLQELGSNLDPDTWDPSMHAIHEGANANVPGILDDLARSHSRPLVRAVALALATSSEWKSADAETKGERLRRALASDPDPLVRMTALKVAGIHALDAKELDLKAALLEEKDPLLMATAIEALTLAALGSSVDRIAVLPGVLIHIPEVDRTPSPRFDAEVIRRLEDILREERNPGLRDAASSALVAASVANAPDPNGPEDRSRRPRPGLEVREWCVWKERAKSQPAGQPAMATVQSAVFFHDAAPAVLDIRASLLGGLPATFRPKASNIEPRSGRAWQRTQAFLGQAVPPEELPALDKAFWALGNVVWSPDDYLVAHPIELDPYRAVPWAYDSQGATQYRRELRGFRLRWCGLRVGYGMDLEGEVRSLPEDTIPGCWARASEAKSTPIALRGDHDRFLFFEGSTLAPSPVVIEWADPSKQALVLRTRDFLSLPHCDDWERQSLRIPNTAHVPAALVVRKEPGKAPRGTCLRNLPSRSPAATVALERLDLEGSALVAELRKTLEAQGWADKNGEGLLAAWTAELLEAEGTRVLTVLPQWLHDAVLPLEITPVPGKSTRIGIVWKDCEGLEVRRPVREDTASPFGTEEPIEVEVSVLETRREPLSPGPAIPFELREDGLLAGIWPGQNTMMFAEDGRFIVHPKDGLTGIEILVGDLETRQFRVQVRLPPPLIPDDYTVSADGSRIGMLVLDGARYRVFIADIRAGALIEVAKGLESLAWSHSSRDGRLLSFLEDGEPRVFDLETNELRRVRLPPAMKAFYPMLTPDGGKMAFIADTTLGDESHEEIVLLDLGAKTLRRLARTSGNHQFPSISADGRKVLFTRAEDGKFWLYLADVAGSRLLRISPHAPRMHCRGLTDDGSTALFTNEQGIWATDLSTGESRLAYEPRGFRIRDGGVSSDGRKALLLGAHPETGRVIGVHYVDLDLGRK